jgi:DNA-binding NarL/FixJ family response regulator
VRAPTPIRDDKRIRCVLAHDLVLLRQGLRRLLEDQPDMEVIAEAGNAAESLHMIYEHRPDVIITDSNIFGCALAQTEQMILQESPKSKVIFLAYREREEADVQGRKCDLRQTTSEDLVKMIRREIMGAEIREFPVEEISSRKRELTARESEVLKLLAEGRTVRSVAAILGLSSKTVDAHKFNLMRKLGIHNKAELVMWAIQKKVVKLPVNF